MPKERLLRCNNGHVTADHPGFEKCPQCGSTNLVELTARRVRD